MFDAYLKLGTNLVYVLSSLFHNFPSVPHAFWDVRAGQGPQKIRSALNSGTYTSLSDKIFGRHQWKVTDEPLKPVAYTWVSPNTSLPFQLQNGNQWANDYY